MWRKLPYLIAAGFLFAQAIRKVESHHKPVEVWTGFCFK